MQQGECCGDWTVTFVGGSAPKATDAALRIVFDPRLREVPRYWFDAPVSHVCVSATGVPFVPLRSNITRVEGSNVNDAKHVLSHVAAIVFGEHTPNQFRWINPAVRAAAAAGGGV